MVKVNRRRYIVFHVVSPPDVGKGLIIKLTRDRTREMPPDDFERLKPWLVYFHNGWGIIRTTHKGTDEMVSLLGSLKGHELKEGALDLNIAGISGTIRAAYYKHIPEKARDDEHYRTQRQTR